MLCSDWHLRRNAVPLVPWLIGCWLFLIPALARGQQGEPVESSSAIAIAANQDETPPHRDAGAVKPAGYVQPQPQLTPLTAIAPRIESPRGAQALSASLFGDGTIAASLLGSATRSTSQTNNGEATARASTDVGNLLGKAPSVIGVGVQRRNPIVTDPRVRGSRVGQLAASGSHWVPARIDLDTAVNKIGSHLINNVSVINGPYSTRLGPGFQFIDIDLLASPRYADGYESHAHLGVDYKQNGNQWFGREALWGGDTNWGWRANVGQSAGYTYFSGDGSRIPAGFYSRDYNFAFGYDLTDDSSVEFSYLGLGQNNVLLPGQVFDIDTLGTDAFELKYQLRDQVYYDLLTFEYWNNATTFNGSAQRPSKRQFFPFLDDIGYVGFTHVNSRSTGYNLAVSWIEDERNYLTVGTDMRLVNQQIDEIGSGVTTGVFTNANSPIPQSYALDFGVYGEIAVHDGDANQLRGGVRGDWTGTDITADPASLLSLGNYFPVQPSFSAIVGSTATARNFAMAAGYLSAEHEVTDHWNVYSKVGASQRAPNLTELYAAQPFMALLQNGLNTVTGDPTLRQETLLQTDIGMTFTQDYFQGGIGAYYAWGFNYITFENVGIVYGPGSVPEQVNLKYVNTDLATFWGSDAYLQYDENDYLTPFGSLSYVQGTDQTRNGHFATAPVNVSLGGVVTPSHRDATQVRGAFNNGTVGGIATGGPAKEALPSILPLQSRLGVRLHPRRAEGPGPQPFPWGIEFSTRIVASQNRVAGSLLETPTRGFTLVDINAYWQPDRSTMLKLGFENIGGINFREHLDFRSQDPRARTMFQPGFTVVAGAERTF